MYQKINEYYYQQINSKVNKKININSERGTPRLVKKYKYTYVKSESSNEDGNDNVKCTCGEAHNKIIYNQNEKSFTFGKDNKRCSCGKIQLSFAEKWPFKKDHISNRYNNSTFNKTSYIQERLYTSFSKDRDLNNCICNDFECSKKNLKCTCRLCDNEQEKKIFLIKNVKRGKSENNVLKSEFKKCICGENERKCTCYNNGKEFIRGRSTNSNNFKRYENKCTCGKITCICGNS